MPAVTLPDGSQRHFDKPVTVAEIAASIGPGLAKAALAGKVDGKLVDTSFVISSDSLLSIVTDRDPDALDILRHSTAHLLAMAVQDLFPEAQVTIGPTIEDGFYYDFAYRKQSFTQEDLRKIELRMMEIVEKDLPIRRVVMSRDEAVQLFSAKGEKYKVELIEALPAGEELSVYQEGEWMDLCRGPHVPSTGKLKAFHLMKISGAYWRDYAAYRRLYRRSSR